MSWNLLRGTLHQRRWSLFWFSLGLAVYSWMMDWFWPQLGEGETYEELVEAIPEEMLALFGDAEVGLTTLGGYFHNEYLGLMWVVIAGTATVMYATRSLSTEIGSGTMELLLAQPISRVSLVLTRILGLLIWVGAISAATVGPIRVFGPMYDIDLPAETYLKLWSACTLFLLAFGGIAFLFSSIARDGGKPAAATGGLLLGMWIMNFLAQVSDLADAFAPMNLLSYWEPGRIINDGTLSADTVWVYASVAVVTLAASVVWFSRRDVA